MIVESASRAGIAVHDGIDSAFEAKESPRDEVESAIRWLIALHAEGLAWRDLALVVPGKRKWHALVAATVDANDVPHRMLIGHPGARPDFSDDVVHAMSLFTATGFDRAAVAIVGLGDLPWKQQTLDESVDATRTAMAVATRFLRVSWSKPSPLVAAIVDDEDVSDQPK